MADPPRFAERVTYDTARNPRRAFWRRFIRTRHRAQLYPTVLAVLGWAFIAILPARLSRAAQELSPGQTTSMDTVL